MDSLQVTRTILNTASQEKRQLSAEEVAKMQAAILDDETVSQPEALLLQEGLKKKRFAVAEIPAVNALITRSLTDSHKSLTLTVGNQILTRVKPARDGLTLEQIKNILLDNKVDEVIVGTPDGKLFIAHGQESTRGALDLERVKAGYIGDLNGQTVMVLHVDNETNTVKEGAKAPIKGTMQIVKTASESGIVKGVTEMGTAVVTIVIGKSVLEKGIDVVKSASKTAAPKVVEEVTEEVAEEVSKKVAPKLVAKGMKEMFVNGATNFGIAVGVTAGVLAVVGGVLAGVGAIHGSRTKPRMETIKMATQQP